ncbi:MAG: arginine--tRNA ligase, partial [Patescibacteria group bacterium]
GREIILNGLKKGVFKQDETGAVYADLEQFGLPNKILLRRDGTTLYITQDIFLAYQKWKDFSPKSSAYVVASEQDLYFKQLFAVLRLLKLPYADHLSHLSYGMVRLPEGKIKSREGTTVDIDNLLDSLVALVKKEVERRERGLSKTEVKKRSEHIAQAALKYYLLAVNPHSDMIFNPKESIALQGKTGPYLLYTYARLRSIARKAGMSFRTRSAGNDAYDFSAEKPLVLALMYFENTVQKAADTVNPSLLASHLYDLAQKTNDYYHATPVLKSEEPARTARLLLIVAIADTLQRGLALLGIKTIEKM